MKTVLNEERQKFLEIYEHLRLGVLQIWWIISTLRKRDLTTQMGEGEFRRSLERILGRRS
jgi:hypothetical protein